MNITPRHCFHEAKLNGDKKVVSWVSGKPMREFLHMDDMAAASIYVMELTSTISAANTQAMLSHINVGTGVDGTIRELVETVAKVIGYQGHIEFDTSKPDGAPRKLMDVERLAKLGGARATV
jgi:GDP-L-fucose synthase